jgi:ABC-2 type transport system permease protein
MKAYLSLFRIRFINGLQYRAAAYAGVATQFAWGFMNILMYAAFYKTGSAAFPMEFSQLSSYIWLQQAFLTLFMTWFLDSDIFSMITSGNIAYELTRPMDLYNMWFVKQLAIRGSKAVLRCLPVILVAALLPEPYGLSLPADPVSFIMFLVTMIAGLFVAVAFSMYIYISTFYTLSSLGVRMIALSLTEVLTGAVIPLPFLPDKLRQVFELLPFASMQNLPLRIYIGDITGKEMVIGFALQIFWLFFLIFTGKAWMKRALKKVVVQGG